MHPGLPEIMVFCRKIRREPKKKRRTRRPSLSGSQGHCKHHTLSRTLFFLLIRFHGTAIEERINRSCTRSLAAASEHHGQHSRDPGKKGVRRGAETCYPPQPGNPAGHCAGASFAQARREDDVPPAASASLYAIPRPQCWRAPSAQARGRRRWGFEIGGRVRSFPW
jgi:hypothetical protein